MGTDHHCAFDAWWEHAVDNYFSWTDGSPSGCDLYYDPVVDEHVDHGPVGVMIPAWYLAPQRREVAEEGWNMMALLTGAAGDGPISSGGHEQLGIMLLQLAGEFADAGLKARIWDEMADEIEPAWDRDTGEFTLGLGLGEDHPRGQLNARAMAGWVCEPGAWAQVFNAPNLSKFDEPTVVGVDFPRVALSEARWDGAALHVAAEPQNASVRGSRTDVRVTNLGDPEGWTMVRPDGETIALPVEAGDLVAEVTVDSAPVTITRAG